jgi:hypothetical protein
MSVHTISNPVPRVLVIAVPSINSLRPNLAPAGLGGLRSLRLKERKLAADGWLSAASPNQVVPVDRDLQ